MKSRIAQITLDESLKKKSERERKSVELRIRAKTSESGQNSRGECLLSIGKLRPFPSGKKVKSISGIYIEKSAYDPSSGRSELSRHHRMHWPEKGTIVLTFGTTELLISDFLVLCQLIIKVLPVLPKFECELYVSLALR